MGSSRAGSNPARSDKFFVFYINFVVFFRKDFTNLFLKNNFKKCNNCFGKFEEAFDSIKDLSCAKLSTPVLKKLLIF